METTYMGFEAKLGSTRGTEATGAPTRQQTMGAKRERLVACAVRTGCEATYIAGVGNPYGQVCQNEEG